MAAEGQRQHFQKQVNAFPKKTAMCKNGELAWQMVDQVPLQGASQGSTSVTSDIYGALGDDLLLP